MSMRPAAICTLIVLAAASVPQAQGGLYEDIYRGLQLAATPSGYPLTGTADGTRVNGQRAGRLRILPDQVGQGYTLEFDRSFGQDSRGRPEILDLGAYELELAGATRMTLGYTRRGMFVGNANLDIGNLDYSVRGKSGVQDVNLSGTLAMQGALEINQYGFYTLSLDVNNLDSQLVVDGVVVTGDTITNFDVGPINIKGNVFYDGLVALLAGLGVDTTGLEQLTPESPIDRIADSFQQQMQSLGTVAGAQYAGDGQFPPTPAYLASGGSPDESAAQAPAPTVVQAGLGMIPEPGTILLVGLGGVFLWGWRRR